MTEVLTALYGAFGVASVAGYVPQMRAVWRSRTGATDVSLLMWSVWSVGATVSVLYAQVVARDPGYMLLSLGNATGCLLVTGSTLVKRYRAAARGARRAPAHLRAGPGRGWRSLRSRRQPALTLARLRAAVDAP